MGCACRRPVQNPYPADCSGKDMLSLYEYGARRADEHPYSRRQRGSGALAKCPKRNRNAVFGRHWVNFTLRLLLGDCSGVPVASAKNHWAVASLSLLLNVGGRGASLAVCLSSRLPTGPHSFLPFCILNNICTVGELAASY